MRYFYAKVGKANSLANDYLKGTTPISKPAIPIFFNRSQSNKKEFLESGGAKEQGNNFFWCGEHTESAKIVVIHEGYIYIAKPVGDVIFWRSIEDTTHLPKNDYMKLLPIKIVMKKRLPDVPAILSSMTANAYYYTGTFREISDKGNVRALLAVLENQMKEFDYYNPADLLSCLSSIELETLVAKIFEELGCFVPAYRGGAIKGIDIFARNIGPTLVSMGLIKIPQNSAISVQVKRMTDMRKPPEGCDYLISLSKNSEQLMDQIKKLDSTRKWFKRSLNWLPDTVFAGYGIS